MLLYKKNKMTIHCLELTLTEYLECIFELTQCSLQKNVCQRLLDQALDGYNERLISSLEDERIRALSFLHLCGDELPQCLNISNMREQLECS